MAATTSRAPRSDFSIASLPGYERLASAGEMGELFVATVRAAFVPPYSWRREFVVQVSTTIRRCLAPAILSVVAFALGLLVYYVASIVQVLGTVDRIGGGMMIAFTREVAVWVALMILGGVAGSAMTADLASRKIREELDALEVLGVDTMRSLIVPRVLALVVAAPILGLICLFVALLSGYVTVPIAHPGYVTHAAFLETVKAFVSVGELANMMIKMAIAGLVVGIVSCQKGLSSKGGAEGVGRAVNEAVLVSFFALWTISIVGNTIFSTLFPSLSILKG
jgi:phospholipid/cholesterol/gamma-HCH transport system permease protein